MLKKNFDLNLNLKSLKFLKSEVNQINYFTKFYPIRGLSLKDIKKLDSKLILLITLFSEYKEKLFDSLVITGVNDLPLYDQVKENPSNFIIKNYEIIIEGFYLIFRPNYRSRQLCNIIEFGAPMGIKKNNTQPTYIFSKINNEVKYNYQQLIDQFILNY